MATKMPKEPATISGHFPKSSKLKPKGFTGMGTDDQVTVIAKGKVKRVEDNADRWDPSKRFTIHLTSCEILTPDANKKVSIEDAIKSSEKRV